LTFGKSLVFYSQFTVSPVVPRWSIYMHQPRFRVGDIVRLGAERFQVLEVVDGFLKLQSLEDPNKVWTVRASDVEAIDD
jgi:hypothetical protein